MIPGHRVRITLCMFQGIGSGLNLHILWARWAPGWGGGLDGSPSLPYPKSRNRILKLSVQVPIPPDAHRRRLRTRIGFDPTGLWGSGTPSDPQAGAGGPKGRPQEAFPQPSGNTCTAPAPHGGDL